jgi:outer membrane receptor for ferrienterochelin and colicin
MVVVSFGFLVAAPVTALAQATAQTETLDEIVVTAEHRSENVQNTAAAVSVRNGDDLQVEGKYSDLVH